MTFGEMQTALRRKLDEASALFWTDQDIKDALNEAQDEMTDHTECVERQATVRFLTGRTYYDLTSLLPDIFLSPRRGQNVTTQAWLEPSDPLDLDRHTYVQWELTQGTPQRYLLRGNWWLGIFPKSASDTADQCRLYYTSIPAHMSASSDEPPFPREFHPGLVDLALSDLLAQERETDKALKYWDSGMTYTAGLKAHVDQRQKIQRIEVL